MSDPELLDPLPTNFDVSIEVDTGGGVTADPYTLVIPQNFDGTITWSLTGASFLNPALTFGGQTPPSFEVSRTATSLVRRWGNTIPGVGSYSYYYTLHMVLSDGTAVTYDPTVENIPPTAP
jgi:hypothetical protein